MQINAQKNSQCSFTGLSDRYSRILYRGKRHVGQIEGAYKNHPKQIGNLPSEIIKDLKQLSASKSELKNKILEVTNAFNLAVLNLHKTEGFAIKNSNELKKSPKDVFLYPGQYDYVCKKAEKVLSKTCKKYDLIKPNERVKIKFIGEGTFAECYSLTFPNDKYSPKVLKVFKSINRNLEQALTDHGIRPEANAGAFIKRARGHRPHNTESPEFYLANLRMGYMLTENVLNYPANSVKSLNSRFGICNYDTHPDNILNGRIVDFGGYEPIESNYRNFACLLDNTVARRNFKVLCNIYKTCAERYFEQNKAFIGRIKYFLSKESRYNTYKNFIEEYNKRKTSALANRVPQAGDVLIGLEAVKKMVPENLHQYLL